MSTTTDIPQKDNETLEHELEQLQALERKTKDLWSGEVVALVVAFIALVLGAGALAAGLSKTTGGTSTVIIRSGSGATAGSSARSTMPMHNSRSGMMGTATSGAAGARTVNVTLGEMFVRPDKPTITAGKVTFVAHNTGMLTHELMIERVPIKMASVGHPVEKAAIGMIDDMGHGGSGKMTLKLTPGTYELFCNVPGHYASGQRTTFTVTKS